VILVHATPLVPAPPPIDEQRFNRLPRAPLDGPLDLPQHHASSAEADGRAAQDQIHTLRYKALVIN